MTNPAPEPALLRTRLSVMMFLQYAIWGAWLPLFFPFLNEHRGFGAAEIGNLFAIGATGALVAPFVAGPIADRWVSTERFLGFLHLVGAALVWQLANLTEYDELLVFSLLYSLVYAPTLSLTNSLAFHHLPDRDRDFSRVRVWGTVGWIAVGIGVGQWLLRVWTPAGEPVDAVRASQVAGMADAFRVSAVLGAGLGLYCFTLPHTPPRRGGAGGALGAIGQALGALRKRPLLVLFLVSFPVSCVHQFYFVHTAGFLGHLEIGAAWIEQVLGVGGGGVMTIGQLSEIPVLFAIPWAARRVSRKTLLTAGLLAYVLRFTVFAYVQEPWAVLPALALHGVCFGCFFFVAFMIVDEETGTSVRASAQSLYNLVAVGFGIIAGNVFAGAVAEGATTDAGIDYEQLFAVPLLVTVGCLVAVLALYPRSRGPSAT